MRNEKYNLKRLTSADGKHSLAASQSLPAKAPILTIFVCEFSDTNCTYLFLATPNEQVTIVFDHFKVKADNANVTGGAYGFVLRRANASFE